LLALLNESGKDITAYSLSVTITTKDGTTHTEQNATDYLPVLAGVQLHNLSDEGKGTFEAHSWRDVHMGAGEITDMSIIVSAVIYADKTADVKDVRAFEAMIEQRKEMAAAEQQAAEVMKKANSPQEAKQELERIGKASTGAQYATFSIAATNMKYATMNDLHDAITRSEERANFYGQHLQMTNVQQPAAVQQ
jgi:hypothetical protein